MLKGFFVKVFEGIFEKWLLYNFECGQPIKTGFTWGGAAYAETSVMGAVSGGGAAGTSFSSLGASLGASGSGTGFGGLVILRGSRPVIFSPYCFLMASHLIWMKKQDRFKRDRVKALKLRPRRLLHRKTC